MNTEDAKWGDKYHLVDRTIEYDDGDVREDRVPAQFVTVYEVTREWYSPAEGGCWYNHYGTVCSIPVDGTKKDVEETIEFLGRHFKGYGNIYSVLGGVLYEFIPEWEAGSHRTTHKPVYE